jgi:capsule polysaccharide export protein KpsE/RkpR
MDEIFQSVSVVKSTSKSTGLSGLLPDIGGLEELTGGMGSSSSAKELALYDNILTSRRCIEEAIIVFNLMDEYGFSKVDDMIKFFRAGLLETKIDKMAGTMSIGIFDKDPVKAKEINAFLIDRLNMINIEMNVLDAKNNREFIEGRYDLIKSALKKAEDSLKLYQDQYGIAPDIQIRATTQSLIELEVEIKSEEVKLDLLRKILSPTESEIRIQEEKIISLNNQLKDLKMNNYEEGDLGIKGAPNVAMNFLRLTRDVEIQNKMLSYVLPILEQAKIEENKKTPTVLVLDPPNIPDKKAKPKRSVIVLGLILFAFISTYSFYLFKDKWVNFKKSIKRD